MKKYGKKHEDLMNLLDRVPGVTEHMNKFEVRMGQEILQRRIELGLTQTQLAVLIRDQGDQITQATISKVECGDGNIGTDTYNKIFNVLGGLSDLSLTFGDSPKSFERELQPV